MEILLNIGVVVLAYLFGSIPFGFLFVKLTSGKDIRDVQSGRTGGTNAMRAAGLGVGLGTAFLDILKGAAAVWIATSLFPTSYWLHTITPLAAILGHNYSIFLIQRGPSGRLRLGGGAGGAACLGGALGLWAPSALIILPIGAFVFYFIGYASVTTLSVAVSALLIFAIRAFFGFPWQYAVYGLGASAIIVWSLRPNIKRLFEGTERLHGYRARKPKTAAKAAATDS